MEQCPLRAPRVTSTLTRTSSYFLTAATLWDSRACPEAFAEVAGDIDHECDPAVSVADTLAPGFVDTPTMTKL